MADLANLSHRGLDIPDDQLPIKLGQVVLPPNLHKFLRIKDDEIVLVTPAEFFQIITSFHPSTDITGNLSNPQALFKMVELSVEMAKSRKGLSNTRSHFHFYAAPPLTLKRWEINILSIPNASSYDIDRTLSKSEVRYVATLKGEKRGDQV
ncbi:uncharacterized protein MELLADRAFT_112398 [Melampsora larici-populina 98AG31]|uniref:Uncharacterized protein n=1 Tax=Melampsora larici-populina (strain 98AG31 / pathotype 3-4-7) TaxID=747676 RepID=F4S6C7_MELLP|nr:uncharacterized protein MELLADRAFT_112398 [Melampsora larici-populina 98AG31]EGF99787.1 hypothetical protein MELLADRAFT_112398 [Melampsora larici-populina 98AG31]